MILLIVIFASFYHPKFEGRKTANGEIFSNSKLTAAYNQVPLGSIVEVTNLSNNKSIIVKVNDRCGINSRIDLSKKAFTTIANKEKGIIKVTIKKIK